MMRSLGICLALVLLTACGRGSGPAPGDVEAQLDFQITTCCIDSSLSVVVELLQRSTGLDFALSREIKDLRPTPTVCLRFWNMRCRNVLTWVTRLTGTRWRVDGNHILIQMADTAPPVRSDEDAVWQAEARRTLAQPCEWWREPEGLGEIEEFVRRQTGLNVIVDPVLWDEAPLLDAATGDGTVGDRLERKLRQAGLHYELRDEAVFITR